MISLFFIEFIRVGGGERFRIDDSQSLDFIYDTASLWDKNQYKAYCPCASE